MQVLINRNATQFEALKAVISSAAWNQCINLWTKVPRDEMGDAQWLKQSGILITAGDTLGHKRFWIDWCGVIGWDPRDIIPTETEGPPMMTFQEDHYDERDALTLSSPCISVHSVLQDTVEEESEADQYIQPCTTFSSPRN